MRLIMNNRSLSSDVPAATKKQLLEQYSLLSESDVSETRNAPQTGLVMK